MQRAVIILQQDAAAQQVRGGFAEPVGINETTLRGNSIMSTSAQAVEDASQEQESEIPIQAQASGSAKSLDIGVIPFEEIQAYYEEELRISFGAPRPRRARR
jgi:hypothetical protein